MLCKKAAIAAIGSLLLVGAAGGPYRAVTGECPVGAFCHYMHGDSKAETVQNAPQQTPPTAN